jgi:hypothetical protein
MENQQKKSSLFKWIIGISLFGTVILGIISLATKPKINEKEIINTEVQTQVFHNKGEKLNKEVGDVFINSNTIFLKSHLENISNSFINLELTVNDSWYSMPKYQQERLLEDSCRTFDTLTVKHGLRKENDMPWRVIFLDSYEKSVAEDKCW